MKEGIYSFIILMVGIFIMLGVGIAYTQEIKSPGWVLHFGSVVFFVGVCFHFSKYESRG